MSDFLSNPIIINSLCNLIAGVIKEFGTSLIVGGVLGGAVGSAGFLLAEYFGITLVSQATATTILGGLGITTCSGPFVVVAGAMALIGCAVGAAYYYFSVDKNNLAKKYKNLKPAADDLKNVVQQAIDAETNSDKKKNMKNKWNKLVNDMKLE